LRLGRRSSAEAAELFREFLQLRFRYRFWTGYHAATIFAFSSLEGKQNP